MTSPRDPDPDQSLAEAETDDENQQRAQAALLDTELSYRLLVDRVRDYAIFQLDPEGRIVTWNAGAELIKGYQANEVLGRHFSIFFPANQVAAGKPQKVLEWAAAQDRFEEETWRVRKGGSLFWADVVITALRDDEGILRGFAKVTRDLTERKRAEDARHQLDHAAVILASALHLDRMLDEIAAAGVPAMADWCLVDLVGEDGVIRQASAAHVDPEKAELARELGRALAPDPDHERGVARVIRTGRSVIHPEFTDMRWMGELVGIEHPRILRELGARSYMSVPLLARGRALGAISFVRAEPGYRYGECDLRSAEEFGLRTGLMIDNARLYEQAQAAIRARDEFLAIAAHELRTPVTTLQLGLDSIAHRVGSPVLAETDGRLRTTIATVERQALRLASLVEGLLDVSRITTGRLPLEREELDLAEAVQEVVNRHRPEACRAGSEIRLRVAPVVGFWDRARVEQITTNLLSNAIKYGAGKPIDVSIEQREDSAVLTVRDSGIGIPAERLSDIFGMFERAASLRAYGGLGLGLYITHQVVEAHGGTIDVSSEPGSGSTFTVTLPLWPPATPEAS